MTDPQKTSVFMSTVGDIADFVDQMRFKEAVTPEEKMKLFVEFLQQKKIVYLGDTDKSKKEIIKDITDEGFNVKTPTE